VPRHEFVPPHLRKSAYADGPLPIGHGQTISQPYIVAFMTEAVDPQPDHRVLEIGSGCGYQTAVLAELAGEVFSVEIVAGLAEKAAETLSRLGYASAHVRQGNGWRGWPEHAPYDAIVVTCAPVELPTRLLDQLKVGGRMIVPVGSLYDGQELVLIEKTERGYDRRSVMAVRFVPMTGKDD
ncbi:MAG TPA: protein-L-isoaspartate(D-aspartate) O-methyltransferase, partial [Verrucomicrobiales bacterium]|nr:protein-L-isoaspartate(D-aspartate) O-methyltransferase [Verrucomicrobiales bacterium]